MEQKSKDNHAGFRNLLRAVADVDSPTHKGAEKLVRTILRGCMENCPKDLLVKVGGIVVDYNLEEWKLYDARN